MKIVLVKIQNKDKPYIMYNNEPLECVESFKYFGLVKRLEDETH